jgi:hypothetical protein
MTQLKMIRFTWTCTTMACMFIILSLKKYCMLAVAFLGSGSNNIWDKCRCRDWSRCLDGVWDLMLIVLALTTRDVIQVKGFTGLSVAMCINAGVPWGRHISCRPNSGLWVGNKRCRPSRGVVSRHCYDIWVWNELSDWYLYQLSCYEIW